MERKRAYLEIARDILEVPKFGSRPTALVYKANLNFNIIKKYLQELEEAGLIMVEPLHHGAGTRLYTTTDKGHVFMEAVRWTLEMYQGCPPGGAPPDLVQEAEI